MVCVRDEVSTNFGATVQHAVSRQPADKGSWHLFASFTGGHDMSSPATARLRRGNGPRAYNGWPDLPKLEALRDAWLVAGDNRPG